jgi:hypothetical protein
VNALQSIIAMFLQASKTPVRVINTLARIGISISTSSIDRMVDSLSSKSANKLRDLGQTLLACYAYDNFDVDLKTHVPTIDKPTDTLKHLTSALCFPLEHGITCEDMKCSDLLWAKSGLNPYADPSDIPPSITMEQLLNIHPEPDPEQFGGLSRRDRYNSWKFLFDLVHYGPVPFHALQAKIGKPDIIEQIPVTKTPITPARAMNCSNSSVSGNIETILNLMEQGGLGDPNDMDAKFEVVDVSPFVVLFHGDLGTGDRILSILQRRAIEKTPWNRLQYAIFVPGLFHVKMACADAVWRAFLKPLSARLDPTSLMQDVAKLRSNETGTIGSNPGFRRMHQVIGHSGICRRLDCWRIEVNRQKNMTLEQFAASKPTLEELKLLADYLALNYISNTRLVRERRKPADLRDQQLENGLLLNRCCLLYEELTYAMNTGDIGRVETCLVSWIIIFKAVRKHKYAFHITRFLSEVHFLYPAGLKRAVRYHILVNPSGKEGKYRAVDWCVELDNLLTKVHVS